MKRSNSVRKSGIRHPHKKRLPKNKQKPNYLLLFYVFAVSMLVTAGAAYALRTDDLLITEVKVQGVQLADNNLVKKAADLAVGQNLLLLSKSKTINDIKSLPEVQTVIMGRKFPDKAWVCIKERAPFAEVTNTKVNALVQEDGYVIHKIKGCLKNMPVIIISQLNVIKPGEIIGTHSMKYALCVLKRAKADGLKIAKISVDQDSDMCLNMSDGFYVRLGQPEDIEEKMSVLRQTLACKPSIIEEAAYVDVSCPSAPVWKPKYPMRTAL